MTRLLPLVFTALLLALPLSLAGARPVSADQTFIVTSDADEPDAAPGDAACSSTPSAVCTLRAAVMEANALAGNDTIVLPVGVFNLSLAAAGEDAAATGDLDLTSNITINGSSAVGSRIVGSGDRVFQIHGGPSITFNNVTIRGGSIAGDGGGIHFGGGTLLLNNVIVGDSSAGNSASNGGGIYQAGGTLTVNFSTVSHNTASGGGGGIYQAGGGLTINSSTFNDNAAASGGALYVPNGVSATVSNSTLSGNDATGGGVTDGGGGVFASGSVNLHSVTVAGNDATVAGGGVMQLGGAVNLRSTLLGNNSAGSAGPDCSGTVNSQGNNLVSNADGCNGLFNGVNGDKVGSGAAVLNPQIGSLGNNGGPTNTHALQPTSPAIDSGSPDNCGGLANDQRGAGFPRVVDTNVDGNSRCDTGAFELGPTGATVTPSMTFTPSITPTPEPSQTPVPTTATPTAAPTTPGVPVTGTATATFTPIAGVKLPASTSAFSGGGNVAFPTSQPFATTGTPGPSPTPDLTQTQIGLTQIVLTASAPAPAAFVTPTTIPTVTPTFSWPADDVSFSTSREVGVEGGSIACGIFLVTVPSAVAPQGSIFQCETVSPQAEARARLPFSHRGFWHIVEIRALDPVGQQLSRFSPPLQVCAYYQDNTLEAVGGDVTRLVIYTAEDSDSRWVALTTTADEFAPRVCAETDSLSLFRLVGRPSSWVNNLTSPLALAIAGGLCLITTIAAIVIIFAITRRNRQKAAPAA
jgi:CSLREA domain-containing protein